MKKLYIAAGLCLLVAGITLLIRDDLFLYAKHTGTVLVILGIGVYTRGHRHADPNG